MTQRNLSPLLTGIIIFSLLFSVSSFGRIQEMDKQIMMQVIDEIPAGNATLMIGGKLSSLLRSPLYNALKNGFPAINEALYLDDFETEILQSSPFGNLAEFDRILVIGAPFSTRLNIFLYLGGDFLAAGFAETSRQHGRIYEEYRYEDLPYWISRRDNTIFVDAPGGIIAFPSDNLEERLKSFKSSKKLVDDPIFSHALEFVNPDTTLFLLLWGPENRLLNEFRQAILLPVKLLEWTDPISAAINDLQILGVSFDIAEKTTLDINLVFGTVESAVLTHDFLDLAETVISKGIRFYLKHLIPQIPESGFQEFVFDTIIESLILDLALDQQNKSVSITASMKTETLLSLLSHRKEAEPDKLGHKRKQLVTIMKIRTLATNIEMYRAMTDGPPPRTENSAELLKILKEAGIFTGNDDVIIDGWGNALIYAVDEAGQNYSISSYGADGKPGPGYINRDSTNIFDQDITWADGRLQDLIGIEADVRDRF